MRLMESVNQHFRTCWMTPSTGASVAGVFTVGELAPGGTAYLCECIGQA